MQTTTADVTTELKSGQIWFNFKSKIFEPLVGNNGDLLVMTVEANVNINTALSSKPSKIYIQFDPQRLH